MKIKRNTDEDVIYWIGWVLTGILTLLLLTERWNPGVLKHFLKPCPFFELTGFYCPGCGGTRAVKSLLQGKLLKSFVMHPFVPYALAVSGWFMFSQTIQKLSRGKIAIGLKYRDVYLWIALGLVAVNFVVKNVLLLLKIDLLNMI